MKSIWSVTNRRPSGEKATDTAGILDRIWPVLASHTFPWLREFPVTIRFPSGEKAIPQIQTSRILSAEFQRLARTVGIPDLDGCVLSAGHDSSIRKKRDSLNSAGVPFKSEQWLAVIGVPNSYCLIQAGRGNPLAIRRKSDGVDVMTVGTKRK